MDKIYHYTSFETFKKIIEFGAIRLSSLANVDDEEEGFLLDMPSQAPYTFVSCWTKDAKESVPLWKMYVDSPFAIRIGVSPDILVPIFSKKYFISNQGNKDAYVFLMQRGGSRGMEFLSDVIYKDNPRLQMLQDLRGIFDTSYISSYGLTKSLHWKFQDEIRFIVQAVPKLQVKKRTDAILYTCCQEVMDNACPTDIAFIDMKYDITKMLTAEIMLGPSTIEKDEKELKSFLDEKLPSFSGKISRSEVFIRRSNG
ncbi:hypothetical protein [Shewanella baltica]|uniref:hypothetical protein n=1 Tax=Shewanella baltica TaxID=62322 RepID=UPI00217E3483|nr:hypothetical protein [Shewanella baltica]MCS6177761.1 hypothetical protein [Shewanella baltica]MCS6253907.1 hypothetical protein [Shewanella baltica]